MKLLIYKSIILAIYPCFISIVFLITYLIKLFTKKTRYSINNILEDKNLSKIKILKYFIFSIIYLILVFFFIGIIYSTLSNLIDYRIKVISTLKQNYNLTISIINNILFVLGLLFAFYFIYYFFKDEEDLIKSLNLEQTFDINNFIKFLLHLVPLFILFIIIIIFKKYDMLNNDDNYSKFIERFYKSKPTKLLVISNLIFFAFLEEFIFRYLLYNIFEKIFAKIGIFKKYKFFIVFFISLLFFLGHSSTYGVIFFKNIFYYIIGIFLFSLYAFNLKYEAKSFIYCGLLHFLSNLLVLINGFI